MISFTKFEIGDRTDTMKYFSKKNVFKTSVLSYNDCITMTTRNMFSVLVKELMSNMFYPDIYYPLSNDENISKIKSKIMLTSFRLRI